MFLNRLQGDEKQAFLLLAHHVARSDDEFTDLQKSMIADYCREMQIEDPGYDPEAFDLYDVLGRFKSRRSQKVALLEIMALIYADDFMHEEERKVLEKMLEVFDISAHFSIVCTQWAKSVLALYVQGNALIEL